MFSIIVTVYNLEKFVEKCIDSILAQTFKDFELIIINDGSSDNSDKIIKKYISDKRIKYYKKENTGIADTRNYGIYKASGKYVLFVDGDDYVKSDLLEKLNDTLSKKEVDLVVMGCVVIKNDVILEDEHHLEYENRLLSDEIDEIVTRKYMDPPWKYCYNLKFWKKHKFMYAKGRTNEDLGLIPFIMYYANNITSLDYNGYYYVQHQSSITSQVSGINYEKTKKSAYDVLAQYLEFLKFIKDKKDYKAKVLLTYFSECVITKTRVLKDSDIDEYIKEIRKNKVVNYITGYNIKKKIKKIVAKINIKLYLKLFN